MLRSIYRWALGKWLTALCLLALAQAARGQSGLFQPGGPSTPQWLSFQRWSAYAEIDVESEHESETAAPNSHFTSDRLYLAPTLGLDLNGSIYHPNFLDFTISGQGGYVQETLSATTSGAKLAATDTSFLQDYSVELTFLRNQPYTATFTTTKAHTLEELDIFNQLVVDTQTYGGHMGYAEGPIPFSVSVQHTDETESGLLFNNSFIQDYIQLKASSERGSGSTYFSYNIGQYDQMVSTYSEKELFQYGSLNDLEKWGPDNRFTLTSSLFFDQEDDTNNPSQNLILQETLKIHLTPHLDNFYTYNFNDDTEGPADTTVHFLDAGLSDKLFESLQSEIDLHGALDNGSSPGSSSSETVYGIGNGESYVKRLGGWGRLTLGNTSRYDIQNEVNSGGITPVLGEHLTISDSKFAYLSQPLVISIQQVSDTTGSKIYIEGIDYTTVTSGYLTGIRRLISSPSLTNGTTVVVNYTVQSQPSGSFDTFSDQFQFRLDLFNGLVGVYSGVGWIENYTRQDFLLDNEFTTLSGVDVTWNWLRAGGSYETRASTLIDYNTTSFYQTATFVVGHESTLTINGSEQWSTYPSQNLRSADYVGNIRLSQQLSRNLAATAEIGVRNDQGGFLNQTLFAARADIHYNFGKLLLSLDYEFNQDESPGELLLRNFVAFKAKRIF